MKIISAALADWGIVNSAGELFDLGKQSLKSGQSAKRHFRGPRSKPVDSVPCPMRLNGTRIA
jgi:hypothetical protein